VKCLIASSHARSIFAGTSFQKCIQTHPLTACRSKAIQIGMNLAALEEWIEQMGLPPGVRLHFVPVRNLLNWLQVCHSIVVVGSSVSHSRLVLQCLSSISEFPELVATIQTMRSINPLQVRPSFYRRLSVSNYSTRCAVQFATINMKSTRGG
jgi:hypothetical protein